MLPILSAIPDPIKQQIADALVDFLVKQAEKVAGEQIAGKIRKFSSKGEFAEAVEKAIIKGAQRFAVEYADEDEDLAAAISANPDFWKSKSAQKALTELIKRPGAWNLSEYAEIASHFEDVLPERRNRIRVDKAVTYFLRCIVEELWTLPGAKEVREVYALQFQKISAEVAKEQAALARKQLEATVQISADLRQALSQLTAAMEQKLLAAPALAALPAPTPKPYHNLPRPDYACFVGRKTELTWLRQRLHPADRAWQIAITGIGGVGKSAMALAISHEYRAKYDDLPLEERFDAIIWISAKEEMLTAQGKERAGLPENVLHTLEDVYTAIARALEREDITRALPEEQSSVVAKALKAQRTLLVIDNLESVQDERIKPFLRNLPSPTKALITSREWLDVADVWQLKGMTSEESDTLIQEEAGLRQVNLDAAQRQRIYDLTSGLPLPIKLAVARLSGGESFPSVERWLGDATGDLPEYCIAGQAELIRQSDSNAWKLWLACSLFDRTAGASREALSYVANSSLADRDSGLTKLQRLFLINRTESDRFWVLPIVQRYAKDNLTEPQYKILIHRWIEWAKLFPQVIGDNIDASVEIIRKFGVEYLNLLSVIRWCVERKRSTEIAILAAPSWNYAYLMGMFSEMKELLNYAASVLKDVDNKLLEGYIEIGYSRLTFLQDAPDKFRSHLQKARQIANQCESKELLGEVIYGDLELITFSGDYEKARNLALELLELSKNSSSKRLKYLAFMRLSQSYINLEKFKEASEWLDKGEKFLLEIGATRWLAQMMYRRAVLCLKTGDFDTAEKLFLENLDINTSWGGNLYVAYTKQRLGQLYEETGKSLKAKQVLIETLELFQRLGMPREQEIVERRLQGLRSAN